jgi:DNA uptake protein ComE-like DNA-binding protein
MNRQRLTNKSGMKGSVLIIVLIVCLGLVSMTLVLGHSMILAYRGSDNGIAGRQADQAVDGAAQYARTLMANVSTPGTMPDPTTYQAQAVPLGDATFWYIGEPDPSDTSNTVAFGLVDEASKLNINTATAAMLENLPGMTEDLAEAIVAWRTSGTSASSSSSTAASSSASSTVKNAQFESVEELAQVNGGTDMETLYGNDTNLNHVCDANETGEGPSSFSPGLLEYVTVFSRIPNTLPDGTKRVNVTGSAAAVTQLLNTAFSPARAAQLAGALRTTGTVKSVLEFYMKSGMTADELALISGSLTMTSGSFSAGLINVNTASPTVLECVPGISETAAQQIVSTRASQTTPVTNLSWVAPILTGTAGVQAGPYLTAETYQVSADVAAVGRHGRGYRRTLFVIDNSSGTPQIVYRRNLAGLGWALGPAARQALASGTSLAQVTP